jgi:hypothetical protein
MFKNMDLKITQDYLYHLLLCEAAFRYVARAVANVKKQTQFAASDLLTE